MRKCVLEVTIFVITIIKKVKHADVLKTWEYAQTMFRSELLQIAYPKAEIGSGRYRIAAK